MQARKSACRYHFFVVILQQIRESYENGTYHYMWYAFAC